MLQYESRVIVYNGGHVGNAVISELLDSGSTLGITNLNFEYFGHNCLILHGNREILRQKNYQCNTENRELYLSNKSIV